MTIIEFDQPLALPPPPYTSLNLIKIKPNLNNLPDNIILNILSYLNLSELNFNLKLINLKYFKLINNYLISILIPSWLIKIKFNFTSDPLNLLTPINYKGKIRENSTNSGSSTRELKILNLYIISICQRLLFSEESILHLISSTDNSNSIEFDLFNLLQPKTRLEDLIIEMGKINHLILIKSNSIISSSSSSSSSSKQTLQDHYLIWEEDISIELSKRSVKLLLPFESQSERGRLVNKGVLEVKRLESDTLEVLAERIIDNLSNLSFNRKPGGWYIRL